MALVMRKNSKGELPRAAGFIKPERKESRVNQSGVGLRLNGVQVSLPAKEPSWFAVQRGRINGRQGRTKQCFQTLIIPLPKPRKAPGCMKSREQRRRPESVTKFTILFQFKG